MISRLKLPERYEYTGESRSGGMSEVHIFKDTLLERLVAVKCVAPGGEARRAHDELRALQAISSKHVVRLYDYISQNDYNDSIALVEEYIDGVELDQLDENLKRDDFLNIAFQLATGIADIHAAGHVHRDIKPHNAKLSAEGVVKIFDFGLARRTETAEAGTVGFVGTPGFAAPELCVTGEVELKSSADIYAFASTLWFVCFQDVPREHEERELLDFSDLSFELPRFLSELLNDCWSAEPDERPRMADVASGIERAMLKGKHSACITRDRTVTYIDAKNPRFEANNGVLGSIVIEYDGFWFLVTEVSGAVYLNNEVCVPVARIVGDCVIALGPFEAAWNRSFITFDVSHPEFVV